MKPYLLQTLKELALLGAIENKIEISSQELAKQLKSSQQTASRYLLELDKMGMITRELGIKKQLIQVTKTGEEVLQREYSDYQQIFDLTDKVHFTGRIVSGMGEGRYYTEQNGYVKQFKEKLGFIPYPGTLNVEIEAVERNKLRLLKRRKAICIDEFKTRDRTFGGVRCFKAEINRMDCVLVLPVRSHYSNILEFISPEFLRGKLNLKDDDIVDVVVYLN